ncbi:MAG: hypothetical protein C4527_01380 [Candidatus Omnitrophota bacterium]|jgi:hypothetical protein|nr:MAG: hypothetical protein C4527_01380 [Candidatus Omnitrophota bacterium]
MEYYSDRVKGKKARIEEEISPTVWGGIVTLIESLVRNGAFGCSFPLMCPDGEVVCGTDEQMLASAIKAEISEIEWPLQTAVMKGNGILQKSEPFAPNTLTILDVIQFCYSSVAKPIKRKYHNFYSHYHLAFDDVSGKKEFCEKINLIFARNGIAYELKINGDIVRLVSPILHESMKNAIFNTGDSTLDKMLEDSCNKFLNPDFEIRKEGLDKLYDAWERLKTLEEPTYKKESITTLLKKVTSEPKFFEILDKECHTLTEIGNEFQIRHSEIGQIQIKNKAWLDYFYHRLFAMIHLILQMK